METVYNQEAINGILYFLHSKNFSPLDAHDELVQTTGEAVMSLNEITHFYKKIEWGKYSLKEKKEVTLERILKVPNFVADHVNVETRLRLRKTSSGIRNFLDHEAHHIDKLIFEYGKDDTIEISGDDEFAVKYEIIDGGIIMRSNGDLRLIKEKSEDSMIGIIQSDLTTILGNEKLRIEVLKLEQRSTLEDYELGEKVLKRAFSQLSHHLKVRKLISGTEAPVLYQVMDKMEPGYLQSLRLTHIRISKFFKRKIYEMTQWKDLKIMHLNSYLSSFEDIIENWTHFRVARLKFDCTDFVMENKSVHGGVIALIKKLRGSPTFRQYRILFKKLLFTEYNEILSTLRTGIFTNKKTNLGNFDYSSSFGMVEIVVTRKSIWFEEQNEAVDRSDEEDEDYEVN